MTTQTTTYNHRVLTPYWDTGRTIRAAARIVAGLSIVAGTALAQYTAAQANIHSITGGTGYTAGTYRLKVLGQYTAALAYNANAATIRTAIAAILAVNGSANVNVSGGPLNTTTPILITYQGDLLGMQVPLVELDASGLTGTQAVTIAHSQHAHTVGMLTTYVDGATDPCVALAAHDFTTDADGNGYMATTAVSEHGEVMETCEVFYGGVFRADELTGFDAAALADLQGRLISGSVTDGVIEF